MNKINKLRMKLLFNVLMDTMAYSIFSFVMWTTFIIESKAFLLNDNRMLPELAKEYIAGQLVYNRLIDLFPAFLLTFIWVFTKHIGGFTADKSLQIYKQIKEIDANANQS